MGASKCNQETLKTQLSSNLKKYYWINCIGCQIKLCNNGLGKILKLLDENESDPVFNNNDNKFHIIDTIR